METLEQVDPRYPSLHMRLEKFRAFGDSGRFRLAPLSCIVGPNSSGKSSIITALLLLKQSLEQDVLSSRVSPLVLSGPYCDLGRYTDVVHGHDKEADMGFTFSIPFGALRRTWEEPPIVTLEIPQTPLYHYPFYFFPHGETVSLPTRGNVDLRLSFAIDEPFGPSLSGMDIKVDDVGMARFVRTIRGARRQHWRVYTSNLPSQSLALRFHPSMFFPHVQTRESAYRKAGPRVKRRIKQFLYASRSCLMYLQNLLAKSAVIGPFRTPPERRYSFAGFSSTRGGPSGERAIDLLITEELLKAPGHPLQEAISFWLHHLNLAKGVSVRDIAKGANLFAVDLAGVGQRSEANLADVGYGISQVLPVLVQGLLMLPGGIYMVQQPEIHLHPDAQAGLADFFLYLCSKGVRTVIETHSEYFLIRLRRRLAERKLMLKRGPLTQQDTTIPIGIEDVAILLTSIDRRTGGVVKELEIGKSFQFENLPRGFMSQAVEDRIALLKAVGRRS